MKAKTQPKSKEAGVKTVCLEVPEGLWRETRKMALDLGISVKGLVEQALSQHVNQHAKQPKKQVAA